MNNGNCDWLFELAEDLDLMILKTILLGKKNEGNAGWNQRFSAEWSSYREMLRQEIEKSRPDLVLVNDPSALGRYSGKYLRDTDPKRHSAGIPGGSGCSRRMDSENGPEGGRQVEA